MSSLGKLILFHRQQLGMTRLELSLSSGLSTNTLYRVESGKSSPKIDTIARIEEALGLEKNTLLSICSSHHYEEIHFTLPKTCLINDDELIVKLHIHVTDE